jgi:DNA-binding MarR family transcriptional regulator
MEIQSIREFRKILRRFERLTNLQLKNCCSDVSLAQCHVLLEIEESKQATTGELAKELSLDKSTLSRTIDGLVKAGLVRRLPHPTDRRYTLLALTHKGKETCNSINHQADGYYNIVFDFIPDEKHGVLIRNFASLVQAFLETESRTEGDMECCDIKSDE